MKVQVIESFSPAFGTNYNVGDVLDVDAKTAKSLIDTGRVVEGEIKPYENFQPFSHQPSPQQPLAAFKPAFKPKRKK